MITSKQREEYRSWPAFPEHVSRAMDLTIDLAIEVIRELASPKACFLKGNYCPVHGIRVPLGKQCPHERAREFLQIVDQDD